MAIKINFDVSNIPENPTLILATRKGDKIGKINAQNIIIKDSMTNGAEITFKVNKYINNVIDSLWYNIKNYKLVYCKEADLWFQAKVDIDELSNSIKNVSCIQLAQAELSQIMLYDIEINTENDIARDDYTNPTVLYNDSNHSISLLHRIMGKVPHYQIVYVSPTIANIQRTFTFDDISLYDAFSNIAEEIGCLFVFHSDTNTNGDIRRGFSVYDLESYCTTCGNRGHFANTCPKCGGSNILEGYGEDTTIFITADELGKDIKFTSNTNLQKNCFKLEAGDNLMTATIRNCNPNGTDYIWYIPDYIKEDMSNELKTKLNNYDNLYNAYNATYSMTVNQTLLNQYNQLVVKYSTLKPDISALVSPIIGYSNLITAYYQTIDFAMYLQSEMLPTNSLSQTNANAEIAKLSNSTISPVAVINTENLSLATSNNAVLSVAKCLINANYQIKIISSSLNGTTWNGTFYIENYSDENDNATSNNITITINNDYANYVEQKIQKVLSQSKQDAIDVVNLFDMSLLNFTNELKKYNLDSLNILQNICQSCIDIMIEQGVAINQSWNGTDIYNDIYMNYYNKLYAINNEQLVRENEINIIIGKYNTNNKLIASGIQTILNKHRQTIQGTLNFEHYLGHNTGVEQEDYTVMLDGYFYGSGGTTFSTAGWAVTNPIYVCKGDIIDVTCNGFGQNVSVITQCDSSGAYQSTLVAGTANSNFVKTYSYTVENDMYICFTFKKSDGLVINIKRDESLWLEFSAFRREDIYKNDNYISDGLNNAKLFEKALEFIDKAKKELYASAELQHSISASLSNLLVIPKFHVLTQHFKVGNWLRVLVDDNIYKLRLINYEIDYNNLGNISVEFSDVIAVADGYSDEQSLMQKISSMATSYNYTQHQAEQGSKTHITVNDWVRKGLNVTNNKIIQGASNQTQTWDEHGMLFRQFDDGLNDYDDCQLKIINSTLAMTDDNWQTVKTAVGKYYYIDPITNQVTYTFGTNAETIVGKLILGEQLGIYNSSGGLTFNNNGFNITNGKNTFNINPNANNLLSVTKTINNVTDNLMYLDNNGKLHINGADVYSLSPSAVQIAWNGVSESIKFDIVSNRAGLSIYNLSNNRIVRLDNAGLNINNNLGNDLMKLNTSGLNLYGQYDNDANTYLLMSLNSTGQTYYYKNDANSNSFAVGKIGTNSWSNDSTFRGLQMGLRYGGSYLAWTHQETENGNYTVKLIYYAETTTKGKKGIHIADTAYLDHTTICNNNLWFNNYVRTIRYSSGDAGIYSSNRGVSLEGTTALVKGSAGSFEINNGKYTFYNNTNSLIDCYNNIDMHNYTINNVSINSSSDIRMKTNIDDTSVNAVDILNQIEMKSFDWITDNKHEDIGIIAQQLQEVLPDLVYEDKTTTKLSIQPIKFIPYLIKAIQELSLRIDDKSNLKNENKNRKTQFTYSQDDINKFLSSIETNDMPINQQEEIIETEPIYIENQFQKQERESKRNERNK